VGREHADQFEAIVNRAKSAGDRRLPRDCMQIDGEPRHATPNSWGQCSFPCGSSAFAASTRSASGAASSFMTESRKRFASG